MTSLFQIESDFRVGGVDVENVIVFVCAGPGLDAAGTVGRELAETDRGSRTSVGKRFDACGCDYADIFVF